MTPIFMLKNYHCLRNGNFRVLEDLDSLAEFGFPNQFAAESENSLNRYQIKSAQL